MSERVRVDVRNEGSERYPMYAAEWDGETVRAHTPWLLAGRLMDAGMPAASDLHLIEEAQR